MEEIWVTCPCCGAKFPYPPDDPVHTRDQMDLFGKVPTIEEKLREASPEVYHHEEES